MKKRLVPFLLALAVLVVALVPAAMAGGTVKYVYCRNGKPLNVRAWPDINSALLGKIPVGTAVTVEAYTSNYTWANIRYNGQSAYVMTQYLVDTYPGGGGYTPTPTPTPVNPGGSTNYQSIITSMENEFSTYRVVEPYTVLAKPVRATGWVNLRYVPSTEFGHADNLYANTQLTVIAETRNWLQVRRVDTGVTGWVMRQYVITMGVGSGN